MTQRRRWNIPVMSKEALRQRQHCSMVFTILFGIAGASMFVVAVVLGMFYLIGAGTTFVIWSVLCGCGSLRYYQAYTAASRAPSSNMSGAQRQTHLPQEYTITQTTGTQGFPSSYSDPSSVPPPYPYSSPPTYESATGYTNWN